LEFPQYTRPTEWEGLRIPEVLLSGHHGRIAAWRHAQAERLTKERRPDLWRAYVAGTDPDATAGDPAGDAELSDAQITAATGGQEKDDTR
jgi:tRNA (guanine37-N1)-methyltransferase